MKKYMVYRARKLPCSYSGFVEEFPTTLKELKKYVLKQKQMQYAEMWEKRVHEAQLKEENRKLRAQVKTLESENASKDKKLEAKERELKAKGKEVEELKQKLAAPDTQVRKELLCEAAEAIGVLEDPQFRDTVKQFFLSLLSSTERAIFRKTMKKVGAFAQNFNQPVGMACNNVGNINVFANKEED